MAAFTPRLLRLCLGRIGDRTDVPIWGPSRLSRCHVYLPYKMYKYDISLVLLDLTYVSDILACSKFVFRWP